MYDSMDPYPNAFNMGEILQAKTGFLFGEIGSLIRAGTQYVQTFTYSDSICSLIHWVSGLINPSLTEVADR